MGKVVIDKERCKGCRLCIEVCPKHLLGVAESTNSFGYRPVMVIVDEGCTGCALCAVICPDLAIEVYK
jgi:2-oxoglutarate ferredoxin oxidoreductase subunit delta